MVEGGAIEQSPIRDYGVDASCVRDVLQWICIEHLHSAAKRFRLGFVAQSFEKAGTQAEQWLFTPWDLNVLAILFPRCNH